MASLSGPARVLIWTPTNVSGWSEHTVSVCPGLPNLIGKICGITEICEVNGSEKVSNSTKDVSYKFKLLLLQGKSCQVNV